MAAARPAHGRCVLGVYPFETFQAIVEQELAKRDRAALSAAPRAALMGVGSTRDRPYRSGP